MNPSRSSRAGICSPALFFLHFLRVQEKRNGQHDGRHVVASAAAVFIHSLRGDISYHGDKREMRCPNCECMTLIRSSLVSGTAILSHDTGIAVVEEIKAR